MRDYIATAEPISPMAESARSLLGGIAYLGAWVLLGFAAARAIVRPKRGASSLLRAVVAQCDVLLLMGIPLVGLAHVGLGSFLAMQAYYGATFVEGVGPVVG